MSFRRRARTRSSRLITPSSLFAATTGGAEGWLGAVGLTTLAVVFAPLFHRFLHKFRLDTEAREK